MLERYLIVIGNGLSSGELAFRTKEIMCLGALITDFEHSLYGVVSVFCHIGHQDRNTLSTCPCSENLFFV